MVMLSRSIARVGVGDRGAGGAEAPPTLENFQKSALIGQKFALSRAKIVLNNGFFIGQPP